MNCNLNDRLFLVLFLFLIGGSSIEAQTLSSQAEVDAFDPSITDITGNLTIDGDDIVNIDALSNVTTISGSVNIEKNNALTNIDGLSNVTDISGELDIEGNDVLTDIDGFSNLTDITGIVYIGDNDALNNIGGFTNLTNISGTLYISSNSGLTNIDGFSNLIEISGTLDISSNNALTNIDGLTSLTDIIGTLEIQSHNALNDWSGLSNLEDVSGTLEISFNTGASEIVSFANLRNISGTVDIGYNYEMNRIDFQDGLENISGTLSFTSNTDLTTVDGLNNLSEISGNLSFTNNDLLTTLDIADNLTDISGGLFFEGNNALSQIGIISNLSNVSGTLLISWTAGLSNLDALSNLTNLTGTISIQNTAISDIEGLNNLEVIEGTLSIQENYNLLNLDGLRNVTNIPGALYIRNCNELTNCCGIYPVLYSGSYNEVIVSDNINACGSIQEILLDTECGLFLRHEENSPCIGLDNGSIQLTAINYDTIPFIYNWEHEETGTMGAFTTFDDITTIQDLVEGTYNVSVTQPNGDMAVALDIVLDPINGSVFEITELTTVNSVNGVNNGSISISYTGGQAPYSIQWSGASPGIMNGVASDNYTISNLLPGEYNLSITDANNIQVTIDLTLLDETVTVVECEEPMDIIILNLVSVAINSDEYKKSKIFFNEFFESINLGTGSNDSRASIAEWSGKDEQDLKIPITGQIDQLFQYEDQERSYSSNTAIIDALEYGSDYLRTNARPNAQKVIIFTFDGCVSFSAAAYAEELKEEGFVIADIGIDYANSSTYRNQLTEAATTPDLALFGPNFDQVDPLILRSRLALLNCLGSSSNVYFDRDGTIEINSVVTEQPCLYPSSVDVTFTVDALLQLSIPAGTPVTFYHNNPMLYGATPIATFIIPCSIPAGSSETFTITLPIETATHLFAVLNDDGMTSPSFELPVTNIEEALYSNNIDDERICTDGFATLQALKASTSLSPICEEIAQYTIDVCNISDVDAIGVSIQDEAATGFVLLETIVNDNGCSTVNGGTYDIPSGCCISLTLNYDISAADFGYYGDQDVFLSGPAGQTYLDFEGENTTAEDVLIDGEENCGSNTVIFTKEVNQETTCEDHSLTYTFTIDNQSSNALIGVEFSDILPAPLEWVYKPYNKEGLSISTSEITEQSATFIIDEIQAETKATFVMDVSVGATDVDVLANNTATLSNLPSYINDGAQVLNSNTVSTTVLADRQIEVIDTIYLDATETSIILDAVISGTSGIVWTTTGDGAFSDPTISNPTYDLGPEDLVDTLFALFVEVSTFCGQKGQSILIKRPCEIEIYKEEIAYCASELNGGSALLTWSGGMGPYSIEGDVTIENINSPYTIENLSMGSYDIILMDAMGCSGMTTIVIDTLEEPTAIFIIEEPNCGQNNGVITMSISGGIGPYQIAGPGPLTEVDFELSTDGLSANDYTYTITDQNGCSFEQVVEINEEGGPAMSFILATPDCGQSTNEITIDWIDGEGPYTLSGSIVETDAIAPIVISEPSLGAYSITLTDANGCTDSIAFDIDVVGISQVNIESNCTSADEYIVQITTGDYTVIADQDYVVESLGNGAFQIPVVDITTSISITVTDDISGCDSLFVVTPPDCDCTAFADAGEDQLITCNQNIVELDGSGSSSSSNYTYSWYDLDGNLLGTEINYLADSSGVYQLVVTDLALDCSAMDSVEVMDDGGISLAAITVSDLQCDDESNASIEVTQVDGGTEPYTYYIDGDEQPTGLFTDLTEGSYQLSIIDADGCQVDSTVVVLPSKEIFLHSTLEEYIVNLNEDIIVELTTNVDSVDIASIVWNPMIDCDNCLTATFFGVKEDQSYTVTLTDINGCVVFTQVNIRINISKGLHLPNIIAANGGSNSIFYPKSSEVDLLITEMYIYDRWGSLVFSNSNFSPNTESSGWDGTYKGEDVVPGVFVYLLKSLSIDGESKVYAGDVTVIR